uniref:Phosphoglycerate mutase family protein n=1 Tax=Heterorhabditis bacteriophora TaxID=37862 RepID=A0A1I7WRS5_HETBA
MRLPNRTIWLVRHGQRIDNIDDRWKETALRWDDPPLRLKNYISRGYHQAREVGIRLSSEHINYVFCSPFTRCVETVSILFSQYPSPPPIYIEPGIGESLNACMSPPGRPTMKINPLVDENYEPVYTELPPEDDNDTGCSSRVAITLQAIFTRYPTGIVILLDG